MLALKTIELKVADYMSPKPISVDSSYTLLNAIDLMADKGIGNLVVKKEHHPTGILTEREILEHLVNNKRIENVSLNNIELSPFTVLNLNSSVIDAAKLMMSRKTRLLVFDDKQLVGIITATDMVRAFRRTENNPSLENVLSKKIHIVKYSDTVLKASEIMHKTRIGSVVVTKDKTPFGIFTERDLLVNVLSYNVDVHAAVGGYCSSPLVTANLGIKGGDAAKLMAEKQIKRLVLTKNGQLAAIVTARDIVDAFQWSFSSDN